MIKQKSCGNGKSAQQGESGGIARLVNLGNRHALDDGAGVKDGDPAAQLQDRHQIVRDVEQGHSVLTSELAKQLHNLSLGNGVECAGWFVGDDDGRAMQQGQGDEYALSLANTDLSRLSAQEAAVIDGQLNLRHQFAQARIEGYSAS